MRDHRMIDERSLAFGKAVAVKLRQDDQLVALAKTNIQRWLQTVSPRARGTLLEWQRTLDGPLEGALELLEGTDERSVRLRQSNPFAGVLSVSERRAILREFQTREPFPA
jgi:hypothetical protein